MHAAPHRHPRRHPLPAQYQRRVRSFLDHGESGRAGGAAEAEAMNGKAKVESRKAKVLDACLAACMFGAAVLSGPAAAQQDAMGRLFFTPAQRSSLDVARSQRARATLSTERTEEQPAVPQEQTITYGGAVRRSDGKSTVWINGRPVTEQEAAAGATVVGRVGADGSVSVQVPQSGRSVQLKPGQSVELLSGTIEEAYSRKPVAPEAKPAAKPQAEAKKEAAAEAAKVAEREREDQEKQRLEDALRAVQDAGTLKPAAQPAPSAEGPAR